MKKFCLLILSLSLLLTLLPGCQAQPEAPEEPEILLPAADLARAVSAANADEPADSLSELTGEDLTAYIEAAYGLESGTWEDGAVIQATGVLAYEVAVLRFTDEKQAEQGEETLTAYCGQRAGAFGGYAPEQAALAENGHVSRRGRYVGLFICESPEGAEGLFFSALETGELPEHVEKPETIDGPELAEDMQIFCDVLLDVCSEELKELGGYTVASFKDEGFAQMLEDTYNVPLSYVTDAFLIDDLGDSLFQLLVLHTPSQTGSIQGAETLRVYKDNLEDSIPYEIDDEGYKCYTEEDFELQYYLANSQVYLRIEQMGDAITGWSNYIGLFICENSLDLLDHFRNTEQSLASRTPALPATALACGVTFLDVSGSWTTQTGEPDPDFPDRLLFVPPDPEDLPLYDASAVAAAWEARDPAGLSEYDRAIYDAAAAVLEEVLTEGMSDYEKEVVLYEWIVRNVSYDWSRTDALEETSQDASTPYGGLVNRSAICMGYASTFQLLMDLAGVECVTVAGASRGEAHAWNLVRLDGEWYCADATWDASNYSSFTGAREWRFFNTTSDYMARTGHQWDYRNVPEAVSETHGSF